MIVLVISVIFVITPVSGTLQCYHCSASRPEECTASPNKTTIYCAANQTCGARVTFTNETVIEHFTLDCADVAFCEDPDACERGSGGNCSTCCNCSLCNNATVNEASPGISLDDMCPHTTMPPPTNDTATAGSPPTSANTSTPTGSGLQCHFCSRSSVADCPEDIQDCQAGQVCVAIASFSLLSGELQSFQQHCDSPTRCLGNDQDNCKTLLDKGIKECSQCCDCDFCNAAEDKGQPVSVTGCGLRCYDCSDETGQCSGEAITGNRVPNITCPLGQVCYVKNSGENGFIRGCEDREKCTEYNATLDRDDAECHTCCESQLCNDNEPPKCAAITSRLSLISLAIAGTVSYRFLNSNAHDFWV
jgi:hypothetical protein